MSLKQLYMPAEWHPHAACWMLWPCRRDNWAHDALPAQEAFLNVAKSIATFEPVKLCVPKLEYDKVKSLQIDHQFDNIEVIEMESDDSWMRDVGPTFVFEQQQSQSAEAPTGKRLVGIDWQFNAWGEKYASWSQDALVAQNILELTHIDRIDTPDFILEGGSIHVDGEGTCLTTEECLLNPNRNPHLSKFEIEEKLKQYLGEEKIIWLPLGLAADEDTNGHIDNIACFSRPGQVLLTWTDDLEDEHYPRCSAAYEVLTSTQDAQGRSIEVIKLPIPNKPLLRYQAEDLQGLQSDRGCYQREVGQRLAASYANFYIANDGIVCPSFDQPESDQQAKAILERAFPNRRVIQVPGRDILLGGGNIHCITQQQPSLL